jgi:hypothetical protein
MDAFADQVIDEIGQDLFLEATLFVQRCNKVREDAVEFAVAHPFLLLLRKNGGGSARAGCIISGVR